jgi:preprotein translocase subunit SecA
MRFLEKPGTADLTRHRRLLPVIAAREDELRRLPDEALAGLAHAVTDRAGFCSAARESARRALGERPYDVQLLGAMVMMSGQVAEMATGEGKTLSVAIAAAWYAACGRSVHVMSVNDYLARRDAEWMGPVYELLGITVGYLGQHSSQAERRAAYSAQVTYAAVSEIGFDVLRDRLRPDAADIVLPEPDVVVIDEVDSVLIDEARVPLVLAGAAEAGDADHDMARLVRALRRNVHYEVDDDGRNVHLTELGAIAAERALGGVDLYSVAQLETLTRLNVALHAEALVQRDVDYVVTDGRVQLISPSRGRVARLQRWPDGLQAAVEAKEDLTASETGEILDSITIESLVRRYPRTCGATATAVAVAEQFRQFYDLEVAVIPPNRSCIRDDHCDRLYATLGDKEDAIVAEAATAHASGRPVLIGTLDVAESERLARSLAWAGLSCAVLNAKNDAEEAAIIAAAGTRGAITVSTQMAGRGTDIRLGGPKGDNGQVAGLGGLHVIGTGRYWSSRLDNQLRGRSGRQGDPGSSVFFVSMEDDLVVGNAPDAAVPRGVAADGPVHDAAAQRAVEHAQRVAEGANLEIHRNTFRYNKLVEDQRRVVLQQRDRALRTGAALTALARLCPQRYRELSAAIPSDVLTAVARQIVLFHLDRRWAEHLAALAEIREGIHLRALGNGPNPFGMALDPLTEFHAEAVKLFKRLLKSAEQDSADTFERAEITSAGIDLNAAGLRRPTATWTYVVQDNPFGTAADRVARRLSQLVHGERTALRGSWRSPDRDDEPLA